MSISIFFASGAAANPGDRIRLGTSSVFGGAVQISIDLNSGETLTRSMPMQTRGASPSWEEKRRQLTPDELIQLKKTIKISIDAGLRSKKCEEEDRLARQMGLQFKPRPPMLDGIMELYVTLDGQLASAPEAACRTHASDTLWEAVLNAARGTSVSAGSN